MSELTIYILLAVAFAVLLLWLLRPRRRPAGVAGSHIDLGMATILPKHYQFFPQIRQALSAIDEKYLREVAPPHVVQQALRERRKVALCFLSGLREDFTNLERLGRMVATLSPVISREQETERLLLGLRFRLFYGIVWLSILTGTVSLEHIEHLTGLVGRLAARMEQAMAAVNALSADPVSSELQS
jgi:hypothetical protein